jgi:hypothetical protein
MLAVAGRGVNLRDRRRLRHPSVHDGRPWLFRHTQSSSPAALGRRSTVAGVLASPNRRGWAGLGSAPTHASKVDVLRPKPRRGAVGGPSGVSGPEVETMARVMSRQAGIAAGGCGARRPLSERIGLRRDTGVVAGEANGCRHDAYHDGSGGTATTQGLGAAAQAVGTAGSKRDGSRAATLPRCTPGPNGAGLGPSPVPAPTVERQLLPHHDGDERAASAGRPSKAGGRRPRRSSRGGTSRGPRSNPCPSATVEPLVSTWWTRSRSTSRRRDRGRRGRRLSSRCVLGLEPPRLRRSWQGPAGLGASPGPRPLATERNPESRVPVLANGEVLRAEGSTADLAPRGAEARPRPP